MVKPKVDFVEEHPGDRPTQDPPALPSGPHRPLKFYSPDRLGVHHIRLLEPTFADGRLAMLVYRHFGLPKHTPVTCLVSTWPQLHMVCEICTALRYLKGTGVDVRRHHPWASAFTNCIDRRRPDVGVHIVGLPMSSYWFLLKQCILRDPRGQFVHGDITDASTGRDVVIQTSRTRKRTRYQTSLAQEPSLLHEDPQVVSRWLGDRFDIERVFHLPNPAEVRAIAAQLSMTPESGDKDAGAGET